VGEDRTDAHSGGRGADRLTIAEAAALLGVHKNTIRNRIKNGSYRAELVQTERGPTYLIERDSLLTNLTTNTLSSASQELVSQQAMEFVQELLRPFVSELGEIREELGAERVRREMAESTLREGMAEEQRRREEAERERDYLRRELYSLREERESPETAEEQQGRGQPHSDTPGAQEGVQRPWRSLWRRIIRG
jgi:excisionase family DNA binding protein